MCQKSWVTSIFGQVTSFFGTDFAIIANIIRIFGPDSRTDSSEGNLNRGFSMKSYPNFYFGIGGVVTYKNSNLPKVIPEIPNKLLVLETDAPYLSPVPHRGKRNEPNYLVNTAQKLAEIKNLTLQEIAQITTQNAKKLFAV